MQFGMIINLKLFVMFWLHGRPMIPINGKVVLFCKEFKILFICQCDSSVLLIWLHEE